MPSGYVRLGWPRAYWRWSVKAALSITFSATLDRRALDELIAVERECCPFFEFEFEEPRRRLTVSVREAAEVPALDAVAAALGTP